MGDDLYWFAALCLVCLVSYRAWQRQVLRALAAEERVRALLGENMRLRATMGAGD